MNDSAQSRHDEIFSDMERIWHSYVSALQESLDKLEREIEAAGRNSQVCTEQWCMQTDRLLAEFVSVLYSLHVPSFLSSEDRRTLEQLKRKVHELYTRFVTISSPDSIFA
jgi:sugar-specific transcriptional regulator TrmB